MAKVTIKKALTFTFITGVLMTLCACGNDSTRIKQSPQYSDGKFRNSMHTRVVEWSKVWSGLREVIFNKHPKSVPTEAIPTKIVDHLKFNRMDSNEITFARLGHSTLLIRLDNKNWLTDPVFSERVSPVQWLGPRRFHEVPMDLNDLPDIEGVIISHNHYDHLDYDSILLLKDKVNYFVVPLGIAATLRSWGVAAEKIIELDWWETVQLEDVEIISTPSQHFSGRVLLDSDKTLWSSWVVRSASQSIYFSGDTGYFEGFKAIGQKYGPFDYAFMECGAYNERWRNIHMMPEDALQAFKDVRGKVLVPIHNGTFDLSTHAWFDPFEQISMLAQQGDVDLLTPVIGEVVTSNQPSKQMGRAWWKPAIINQSEE